MSDSPFPPQHRPVELMSPNAPTAAQLGMEVARQMAHVHKFAAVAIVMQTHDGNVFQSGYTVGMGSEVRGCRQLMNILSISIQKWGSFLLHNEEVKGNG